MTTRYGSELRGVDDSGNPVAPDPNADARPESEPAHTSEGNGPGQGFGLAGSGEKVLSDPETKWARSWNPDTGRWE